MPRQPGVTQKRRRHGRIGSNRRFVEDGGVVALDARGSHAAAFGIEAMFHAD
jgi:hypothetical protein